MLGREGTLDLATRRRREALVLAGLSVHDALWHACAQSRRCPCVEGKGGPEHGRGPQCIVIICLQMIHFRDYLEDAAAFGPFGLSTILASVPRPWPLRVACSPAVAGRKSGWRDHCIPGQLFLSSERPFKQNT